MKQLKCLVMIPALLLITGAVMQAGQDRKVDLSQLSDLIETAAKEKMPEWKYSRGEPVYKGEHVLISALSSGDKRVRVAVVPHHSQAEAESALQDYVRRDKRYTKLDDFDLGHSCEFANAQVCFQKGPAGCVCRHNGR